MILVTGGTGLVGSYLLYDLISKNHPVRAIKRQSSNLQWVRDVFEFFSDDHTLFQKIEWVNGDILDVFSLEEAMEDVTDVYHCAATVSFVPRERESIIKNNIEGTANIVNAALEKNIRKLCHVSSIAAMGNKPDGKFIDEKAEWVPSNKNTAYRISKYESELEVWRGIAEGLKAVIVNPSIILGITNPVGQSGRLIHSIYKNSAFYTTGVNGYIGVRDVSRAMIGLMESDIHNERFILSAENLSYKELFSMIAKSFHKKEPHIRIPSFMLEVGWRAEKIRSFLFGNKPVITKSMTRNAINQYHYNGSKIKDYLDFEYTPVPEVITEMCNIIQLQGKIND